MDTKMLSGLIQNWWQNFGRRIQSWDFQNCPNFHWIFEVFSPHVIGWNWLQSCAVWNFNLIILFGMAVIKGVWQQWIWCFDFELGKSSPGGFVQRAGNIPLWTVSHSDFPLRRGELKTWVRCFTPFWVIQVELQNVVVVLLVCAAVKNFCVTIGWAKYPHKVENLTTQKDTPFATKAQKHQKHYYSASM